ncbi:MAG: 3-hydroxyacyl-ACP dehydratase FabZ [Gemmatimonadota bacterium]
MADIRDILGHLPHRYPFLLVDRVLELEPGQRVVALKNVTINEPFFPGHFPGHPIMPGVLIVEALAQAGGLMLMEELEDPASKVVYFMSLNDVKFRRPVTPGDQLVLEVEMLQSRRNTRKMRGVARVDGQVATEATMMAQIVDR